MSKEPIRPAVWAVTIAVAFSYMGVGVVDPILPEISSALKASPGQTELLFSTYLFVSAALMFFASWVATRIGRKKTLLIGLTIIVVFAMACALSGNVNLIIGFRGGWGVGNALFVSTALAAVLGASADPRRAIMLYEGALGAGMALGPLVGGALGSISWRGPFLGTAVLMAIGLVAIAFFVPATPIERSARRSVVEPFRALVDPRLSILMLAAFVYNYGYFTLLAYAPFPVAEASIRAGGQFTPLDLGLVFFGWGVMVALGSVWLGPRSCEHVGIRRTVAGVLVLFTIDEIILATWISPIPQVVGVILGGLFIGIINTAMTEIVMSASDIQREVASSAYSGVRFLGGACAPTLAGLLSSVWGIGGPYYVGAVTLVVTIALMWLDRQRRMRSTAHSVALE
ncbi:MFS transporter [Cutibacterium sp. WCA-380-WT-3A]|uniref:MFS transporter n=1 Tax=Cutibacterium porci TaxID=2605781 RepID=A0A7K0J671_9ACTN|nr:MFS transporter [Cutibacterium porci]MSS45429.1 MFS transporter [Cutibacterium porci]